jgi:DNA-directed RNA polymerase subunit RPC12/RpoP
MKRGSGAECSECGWPILLKGTKEGRGLICPSCGTGVVFHTLRIDEQLFESMKKRSQERGVSVDQFAAEAVEEYIEEWDREARLSQPNS